jgi:cytochrome c-type biogenesis protein CcmH/NrfF
MSDNRQERYFNLIDQLLKCPSGQEPEILDSQPDLLDEGLVKTLMQVATMMAHQDNQDAAKFLIFVARQLSKELLNRAIVPPSASLDL